MPGPWLAEDASLHLEIPATNAEAKAHVYHNFQGFPNPQPVAPDGTKIPEDHFYIISVGVVNGVYDADGNLKSGIEYEANTMGSTLNPSYPLTPQAIFGYDEIDVDGQVAHFDSSTSGPWAVDDGGTGTGDHMACPFPEGTVGIATKDDTKMIIRENAKIDGHIIFGVGTPNSEKIDEQTAIASFPGGASPPIATTPLFAYGRSRQISGTPNQPNVNGEIGELVTDPPVVDMNFQPSDYYQT
ncbi:MAG TPA: hypothetical protein EYO33_23695, partial [Phycisphaerales bacterium]|nr:hypothetical protein [Phycisphaerales bacterium]